MILLYVLPSISILVLLILLEILLYCKEMNALFSRIYQFPIYNLILQQSF